MIFVTVGAQMPFDRLVRAVDEWAGANQRSDVFAQIGPTSWRPRHIEFAPFLDPPRFRDRVRGADLLVAHAGMGSIITAMEAGKPILIMPRRGDLRETRNDHQSETAVRFRSRPGITVALDEDELKCRLECLDSLCAQSTSPPVASPELIDRVRAFVDGRPLAPFEGVTA